MTNLLPGFVLLASAASAEPLDALRWMAGCWHGNENGALTEECWLAPRSGLMLGMNRTRGADGKTAFEYLRIDARDGTPTLLPMPNGEASDGFVAERLGQDEAVFANPRHDFPQRIIYRRDGERLRARIEGRRDGKPISREWLWTRGTADTAE